MSDPTDIPPTDKLQFQTELERELYIALDEVAKMLPRQYHLNMREAVDNLLAKARGETL